VYPILCYREEQVDEIIRTDDTSSRWLDDGMELLLLALPDAEPVVVDEPGDVVVDPAPDDALGASEPVTSTSCPLCSASSDSCPSSM
jgi:hypothetical protein